ncbi:glycosyltransferase family 9 protein [bacterium]|nr:glycosyltransferase family 9 protein [bacterium]
MLTPFIKSARKAFPESKIYFLSGAKFQKLLSNNPYLDSIIVADKRKFILNPVSFICFLIKLKRMNFDLVFDVSHAHSFSFQSGLYSYCTRAHYRVGFNRENAELFLNLRIPLGKSAPEKQHESMIYLNLLEHLGKKVEQSLPSIYLDDEDKKAAIAYFQQEKIESGEKIGIHIGGRRGKIWGIEYYAKLADLLSTELNAAILIFSGKNELNKMQELRTLTKAEHHHVPVLPIRTFAAVLHGLDLFISVDTGPMHLAVAVDTPTIEIFFVNDYERYGYSETGKHKIIYSRRNELEPETILEASREVLNYG